MIAAHVASGRFIRKEPDGSHRKSTKSPKMSTSHAGYRTTRIVDAMSVIQIEMNNPKNPIKKSAIRKELFLNIHELKSRQIYR